MMGWTRVENRLPKSGERILIYWTHRGKQTTDILDYEDDALELLQGVTHWAPITPPGSDGPAPDDGERAEEVGERVAKLEDLLKQAARGMVNLERNWIDAQNKARGNFAPDERRELGEALIEWAATERTNVHSWEYELIECPFCGEAEDENDYNSQLGYGRIMHKSDCLHLRARQLQERDDES